MTFPDKTVCLRDRGSVAEIGSPPDSCRRSPIPTAAVRSAIAITPVYYLAMRSISLLLLAAAVAQAQQKVEAWQIIIPPQASVFFAADGSMIGEVGKESRLNIPLRTMPKYLYQAFIAVEDQRFYQHDGVDL